MTKSFKIVLVVVVVAVLGVGGFITYRKVGNKNTTSGGAVSASAEVNPQALKQAESAMANPDDQQQTQVYASPDGYSFIYPKDFKVGQFEEGEGNMTLIQQTQGNLGMQIYVQDFDEAGPLTVQRIKQDLPDQDIEQAQNASLDKEPAIVFFSKNESLGQTYEVWLVHNKKLFQISGYAQEKDLINKILNTWKWQDAE